MNRALDSSMDGLGFGLGLGHGHGGETGELKWKLNLGPSVERLL